MWKQWKSRPGCRPVRPESVRVCASGHITLGADVVRQLRTEYVHLLVDGRRIALRPTNNPAGAFKLQARTGGSLTKRLQVEAALCRYDLVPTNSIDIPVGMNDDGLLIIDLDKGV